MNDAQPFKLDSNHNIADALRYGASADIWYDAEDHDDSAKASEIGWVQDAMSRAADALAPPAGTPPAASDSDRLEAAMILWEAALELNTEDGKDAFASAFGAYRNRAGNCAVRTDFCALVDPLNAGWEAHVQEAGDNAMAPYDWEFAPWFLRNCVEIHPAGSLSLKPDWMAQCAAARAEP